MLIFSEYLGPRAESLILLRQLWIVNYYVKSLSNNLSNRNETLYFQRNNIFENRLFWHFNSRFVLKTKKNVFVLITEVI